MTTGGLEGLTVAVFESRRAAEMAALVTKQGGRVLSAPSMREVPVDAAEGVGEFLRRLEAGETDLAVFLTGVGARHFLEAAERLRPREDVLALLRGTTVAVRGPKPLAILRPLGVPVAHVAPEPNTWRELVGVLGDVKERRVAIVEYGGPADALREVLEARGAQVSSFGVYRWALPEDLEPLRHAIREIAERRVDVALFTSATQVEHLLRVARDLGLEDALRAGFERVAVASIGPVCTEALEENGLRVAIEPEHPKMGHLVVEVARRARELLAPFR